jgi:hypothetical protein
MVFEYDLSRNANRHKDYVGGILGLVRDGSDWRLDPLMVSELHDSSTDTRS